MRDTNEIIKAAKEQQRKNKAEGDAFLNRIKAGDKAAIDEALQDELYTKKGTLRKHSNEGWLLLLMMMKAGSTFDLAFSKSFPHAHLISNN